MPSTKAKVRTLPKDLAEYDKTEWKTDGTPKSGWGPVPYQFWDDIPRLRSGAVQGDLLWYLCRLTFGLEPDRREEGWPDWTPWVRWDSLAERLRCTTRSVQGEAHEAEKRAGGGLIEIQERRGEVRFKLLFRAWPNLPDYEDVPRPVLVMPEKAVAAPMFEKPFTVRGGKKRSVKLWDGELSICPQTDSGFQFYQESDRRIRMELLPADLESQKSDAFVNNKQVDSDEHVENRNHSSDTPPKNGRKNAEDKANKQPDKLAFTSPLASALADYGILSDFSAQKLVAECQTWAPECSVEEIMEAVRRVGHSAGSSKSVRSVPAVILTKVPEYFHSEAYRLKKADPRQRCIKHGYFQPCKKCNGVA